MSSDLTPKMLGAVAQLKYGSNLPDRDRRSGTVPVYGSNGVVGHHDEALCQGPGIIVGRKGSVGEVHFSEGPFWPIDTTYYIETTDADCCLQWLAYVLRAKGLRSLSKATGVPGLDRKDVHALAVNVPSREQQERIARDLGSALRIAESAYTAVAAQYESSRLLAQVILRSGFAVAAPVSTQTGIYDVAAGWAWSGLTSVARLESGHTPSRRHPEWWGGHVPWLALPDIRKLHGNLAHETLENINDAGLANSSARMLPVGTICVSRTASIGFVTMLGRPMATSQDFCNWVCDPERLDPEFLMYAFMASQDSLRELGSGAVHKTIYMPTIKSFQICAPDIEEQRRIARVLRDRLAAAEALTKHLRERQAEIQRLPQRLLAAAFEQVA